MPDQDARGYYAALELTPSATSVEIREAYRRLSRALDPDRTTDPNAAWKRATLEAAYTVLSDPEGRRGYDAGTAATAPVAATVTPAPTAPTLTAAAQAQPMQLRLRGCDRCKSTDQPRHLTFQWVISVVVMTFKNPHAGVYCARCARQTALFCNAGTSLIGWWGFPWGPIWSLAAIFQNASGGVSSHEATGAINWNNALAFLAKGDRASAYAAAKQVRGVNMAEAMRLADEIRPTLATEPPDPWRSRGPWPGLTIAAGFVAPLIFIGLFAMAMIAAPLEPTVSELRADSFRFAGGPAAWRGHSVSAFVMNPLSEGARDSHQTLDVLYMDDTPYGQDPGFTTLRTEFDCAAHTAREESDTVYTARGHVDHSGGAVARHVVSAGGADAAVLALACGSGSPAANPSFQGIENARAYAVNHAAEAHNGPACTRTFHSGDILDGALPSRVGHVVGISNNTPDPAIVRVFTADGRPVVSFLALAGKNTALSGFPDGSYRIRYEAGDQLGRDCRRFIRTFPAGHNEAEQTFRRNEGGREWGIAGFSLDARAAPPPVGAPDTAPVSTP